MNYERIYLIGLMGSGKSSIGKILAENLGKDFIDSDAEIIARNGVDIATIFEIEGENSFRIREQAVLADLSKRNNVVIATGGGVILNLANRIIMSETGTIIYLDANINILYQRIKNSTHRPLMKTSNPKQRLTELYIKRRPFYSSLADKTIHISSTNSLLDSVKQITNILKHNATVTS